MNNDKQSRHILKCSFLYNIKYLIWIFVASLLSMLVFSLYIITIQTQMSDEIRTTKEIYGTYNYALFSLSEEQVGLVKDNKFTEKNNLIKTMALEYNDCYYNYLGVDKDFFDFTNYEIVTGKYPENENEVLVEKWYLFQLGINTDEMLGASIEILNPQTGKKENKIVTGIFCVHCNTSISNNSGSIPIIIFNYDNPLFQEYEYNIYIELNNMEDAEKVAIELQNDIYNIDGSYIEFEVNYPLLESLGVTESAKTEKKHDFFLFLIIVIMIFVFVGSVIHNVLSISLYKWKEIILTYKLIGICMNKVARTILSFLLIIALSGYSLGIFIGINIVYFLSKYSLQILQLNISTEIVIPYFELVTIGIILTGLIVNIFYMKFYKYFTFTSVELVSLQKGRSVGNYVKRTVLFNNNKCPCLKLALRNIICYGTRKIFLSLSIAICIAMMFVLNVQMNTKIKTDDNNLQYKYLFDVKNYYEVCRSGNNIDSVKGLYSKVINLLEENGYTIYYNTGFVTDIKLNKKCLSNEYKNRLTETASGYMKLLDSRQTINTLVSVMGYSKDMLNELDTSRKITELGNNETIILSRTTDINGSGSFKIKPNIGELYDVKSIKEYVKNQWYTEKFEVVDSVSNLSVYPITTESTLCFVVDIDTYNDLFNNNYVNSFYVKNVDKEVLSKIQDILIGTDYIKIIDQEDEMNKINATYERKIIFFIMLIALSCLVVSINVQLQEIYEFDSRKSEFSLLGLIGVSRIKQNVVIIIESISVYVFGYILGVIISKLAVIAMYKMALNNYLQPSFNLMLGCIFVIIVFCLISIFIACNKINSVNGDDD